MIQRKKRQIRIILLIALVLAILGVGIFGVITKLNNNSKDTNLAQEDLSQFELKSLIVTTNLSEQELKEGYNASSVSSLTFGASEIETYEVKYNTEKETKDAYEKLKTDERIQSVDINEKRTVNKITDSTFYYKPDGSSDSISNWGTVAMGIDETINILNEKSGNEEIVVAVIDSGFDMDHKLIAQETEIISRIKSGFNTIDNNTDITDNDGHGTNVGSIILEGTPKNVKILPIKALEKNEKGETVGTDASIISAINYAVTNGADIINMSLGGEGKRPAEQNAITNAHSKNIICIVSSGNGDDKTGLAIDLDKEGMTFYPAECEHVITVGAVSNKLMQVDSTTTSQDLINNYPTYIKATLDDLEITTFSNYGKAVDFAAPGYMILGLYTEDNLNWVSGTSQATPHIARRTAILKTYNKSYTTEQIEEILTYYSYDLGAKGKDVYYGNGFVNFKDYEECSCNSEKCDGIYCFGCEKTSCIYHKGKTNKLSSIEITEAPSKTIYYNGEEFDPAGMVVTATYSDNTKKAVNDYTHSSIVGIWESLDEENPVRGYVVDIAYTEDKLTKHAEQYITMNKEDIELAPELASIEITTAPAKKDYEVGDTFDPAGMVVTAVYVDGSKKIVTNYTYPTEALTIGMTEVTISYTEDGVTKEVKQAISVKEKTVEKVLSEIRIANAPNKTKYEVGEEFDKTGMLVMAKYTDGTEEMVTDYTILPARPLEASDTKVTIQYSKNGVTKQVNQAITMNVQTTETKTLSEITVSTKPNKTSYIVGEEFDPEGMIVTAIYSDGSKIRVMDYTVTPSGSLKATDTEVIISYNGKTTKLPITVQANAVTEPGNNEFPGLNSSMFEWETNNNSTGSVQLNQGDGTTSGGQLAYTGLEDTIIPIGICVAIAIITISYVSYRKYKDI